MRRMLTITIDALSTQGAGAPMRRMRTGVIGGGARAHTEEKA